jgi:hypothetical protein
LKKLIFLFIIFILCAENISAQWSHLKKLTSGYKDTNPSFHALQNYFSSYIWEFMVFQRKIDSSSRICVLRLDKDGPLDSVRYLTADNFVNRNPCIATTGINSALVLWETNKNGRWDIYGAYYSSGVWTNPFPVDSSAGNKSDPKGIAITSTDFGITYSKEGEVIYRRYNAALKTVVNETNLTASISESSGKPVIGEIYGSIILNFRSQKNDTSYNIYSIMSSDYGNTWANFDTIASTGNNNNTLLISRDYGIAQQVFESERNGKKGVYSFLRYSSNVVKIDTVYSSPYFNFYGMKSWLYPFVFDSYASHINAVVKKSDDSTKIFFDGANTYHKDSITLGDTSQNPVIALNNGVISGLDLMFYVVFNKDSAGFSSLYYKTKIFVTGGITQTGNNIADNFALYQNYPNPFNPTTKIKFDLPKLSDIKITIFDAAGREVKNISQSGLTAGSYEYEFNGESLSSGIYFFRLNAGQFSKTVKMVLMK